MIRLQNIVFFLLLMVFHELAAQQYLFELGQWKQQSLNGSILFEGLYRSQETILKSDYREKPVTQKLTGQFKLNSRSIIWHPNFSQLNIQALYAPNVKNEQFLVLPERSETRTAQQLRINSTFFSQRPLSANLYANLQHNFINREYASSVEARVKDYGAKLSFRNPVAPFSVQYSKNDWWQKELQTGRIFINVRNNIRAEVNTSLGENDVHRLIYSYEDYSRRYGESGAVQAYINSYRLQNNVNFGAGKQSSWRSYVFLRNQAGSYQYDRLQINENLTYELPKGFKLSGLYRYSDFNQTNLRTSQSGLLLRAEHQLFLSLHSRVFYEYIDIGNTNYSDYINQGGLAFDYNKSIPAKGRFTLSYEYRRRKDKRNSLPALLHIANEEHVLRDDQPTYLNNPDVILSSVEVWDETSTIRYQINIDYILIERDAYLEIQRLPGGQIADGQTVYVSYQTRQALSYEYNTNNHIVRLGLSFWKGLVEGYFRYYGQSYGHVTGADALILKNIDQQVFGLRLSKSFVTAGVEITNYNSNIMPYRSQRIYCQLSRNFNRKLRAVLNGNWRNHVLDEYDEKLQYADLNGRITYMLTMFSQIRAEGGYRFQNGRGIDLNLTNLRMEYTTRFKQLFFTLGMELYRRDFSGEQINYNGAYARVERKF